VVGLFGWLFVYPPYQQDFSMGGIWKYEMKQTNQPTLYCRSLIKCNTLYVGVFIFFSGRVIRKWKNQAVLKLKFSLLQPSNSGQHLDFSAKYEAQG